MSSEQISVIIAVYNGAKTLAATLACLAQQTFKNFETVLVNDASTDDSEKIIRAFFQRHPDLSHQYVVQENKGLGGARNSGMRVAHGRFFSLLDQDDIWYPAKLEKIISVFNAHSSLSFVTHPSYRRVKGSITQELVCKCVAENVFDKLLFDDNHFCGSAMSFRREVPEQIGFFSEDRGSFHLSEDYDYWLRAAAQGLQFFAVEEVLGEYVEHGNNFSRNKQLMYANEWNVVLRHYRNRPSRRWSDSLRLFRRKGKIWARQALTYLGA